MSNLDIIRGRQVVLPLTNKSGGQRVEGEVVIVDTTMDDSFTRIAAAGSELVIGVVAETIENNAEGRVICGGYVATLDVDAATNRGEYLKTSTTAGDATPAAAMDGGVFGIALSAVGGAGQISAYLFGVDSGGGGGFTEDQYGNNLARNSPGQIVTDGAEPQWWDDIADATITDEDCVGEGIPDKHERCFKVVTTDDDKYGYQTLVFADEELLDTGITVVSFGCWVLCASATKASIGIYGLNLGLQESAQHTGGGAWEWLEVENITLNGADASLGLFLIVDTDTAYFTMPMLVVNGTTQPWKPRDQRFVPINSVNQFDLNTTGDVAWSDTDCTANTDPLTTGICTVLYTKEPDGAAGSYLAIGHDSALVGADAVIALNAASVVNQQVYEAHPNVRCDDSQVIRYTVEEQDADNDVRAILALTGYWMWE